MSKKSILFLTSAACLLPMILGGVIYNDLPDKIAMQWNFENEANWYAPKTAAAFGLPVFFALVNFFTLLIVFRDPKHKNISNKHLFMVQWSIPFVSFIFTPILLFSAMDVALPVNLISLGIVGSTFVLVGNYLPKCKHNYSIGIRVPWTLKDEDNWNKTHRFTGFLWIIGGVIFIIYGFLPIESSLALTLILLLSGILCSVPVLYSYVLYRRKNSNK